MKLKVVIFEDDKDLADILKEMMETNDFDVLTCYSLDEINWQESDIVLADYRNHLVSFNTLKIECSKRSIPLLAISGADTDFVPQLLKPFSIEELQAKVLETFVSFKRKLQRHHDVMSEDATSSFFRRTS